MSDEETDILTSGYSGAWIPPCDEHDGFSHIILMLKMRKLSFIVAKLSVQLVQLDQV